MNESNLVPTKLIEELVETPGLSVESRCRIEALALRAVFTSMVMLQFGTDDGLRHVCKKLSTEFHECARTSNSISHVAVLVYASQFIARLPDDTTRLLQQEE